MNGISILFVAASLFGLGGILATLFHAIWAKIGGREPVRILNWIVWIVSGVVFVTLMISCRFFNQSWEWIMGEIVSGLIIGFLFGWFSAIKADYLIHSGNSSLKWWQVLAMNWIRGYTPIFCRAKKPASKAANWVWGQIKPQLWWLAPLMISFGMIMVVPRWWLGYFVLMVAFSIIILDKSSRAPWHVRYQGRNMRPMPRFRPYDRPWVDPSPEVLKMPGMRVPFISWVPHFFATITKKWFWIWTVSSAVGFIIGFLTGWWLMYFISYLLFVVSVGGMEIERWNTVYTLVDDGTLICLSSSLENWKPDMVIYNLRKSIGQSLNQEVLLEPFGCIRKTGITAEGGGGKTEFMWMPWVETLKRVMDQVLAPGDLPNNLWFLSGIHWLHGIEIFMSFMNKLGDIFDAAKRSWDFLKPNERKETPSGFALNLDWAASFFPDEKELNLHKKTDKAFFLSYWLWIAWRKYQETLSKSYVIGSERVRLAHLQKMVQSSGLDVATLVATPTGHAWLVALDHINSAARPFMPAVHAWLGQACSPLSANWDEVTMPALEMVILMWGSLTTPSPGTAMFKR